MLSTLQYISFRTKFGVGLPSEVSSPPMGCLLSVAVTMAKWLAAQAPLLQLHKNAKSRVHSCYPALLCTLRPRSNASDRELEIVFHQSGRLRPQPPSCISSLASFQKTSQRHCPSPPSIHMGVWAPRACALKLAPGQRCGAGNRISPSPLLAHLIPTDETSRNPPPKGTLNQT